MSKLWYSSIGAAMRRCSIALIAAGAQCVSIVIQSLPSTIIRIRCGAIIVMHVKQFLVNVLPADTQS